MGSRPRWIRADAAYSEVQRTVDRHFFFKPNQFVRQLIGASAGRALAKFPVKLYWLDFNINHKQDGLAPLSDEPEHIQNVARFHQLCNSLIARGINNYLERDGAVFSTRNRSTETVDDLSLEQQLFYAVTNPCKDGLVEKTSHWKGFSSYRQLAHGEVESFRYIDWTAWHRAGGKKRQKSPEAFVKTVTVRLSPLPEWEKKTEPQRQAYFRREVRALEHQFEEERHKQGRTVLGPQKLDQLDHRDRPKKPTEHTRKPLCHAATREAAKEYRQRYRIFLEQYYKASDLWLSGNHNVEFPRGSYRPPDIRAAI